MRELLDKMEKAVFEPETEKFVKVEREDLERLIEEYKYLCFKIEKIKYQCDIAWKVMGDVNDF